MLPWWVVTSDWHHFSTVQATMAQGNSGVIGGQSVAAGSFTTHADAQAWIASHMPTSPAPPSGGNSGGWYVVTIRPNPSSPFTVKVMQKPFPGPPAQVLIDKGPYPTQAEAQAAAQKFTQHANNPFPGASLASGTFGGLSAIGDFFHRLTEKQTWIRVGEVVGGGIVLFIGVRAMTQGSSVAGAGARKTVTKPATKVAKRAITVAAPEARLAGHVAAKRIAPKTSARVKAHREAAAKYGPRRPTTTRVSHIYHHTEKKPVTTTKKPVKKP